MTSVPEVR